jgi:hypothetical protein
LGIINAYAFRNSDCRDWYRAFADRVIGAVGSREYLPVYRMADGEYRFALAFPQRTSPMAQAATTTVAGTVRPCQPGRGYHKGGSIEYGFEEYTLEEPSHLYRRS